jgi:hypothetical protein
MRTPVVKRQTFPASGFVFFFPLFGGWRRRHPQGRVPDFMSLCRCRARVAAPHTSGGSIAVAVTIAAAQSSGARGGLATSQYPRPVRCTEVAERVPFARSCQARRRGRTRQALSRSPSILWSSRERPINAEGSGSRTYRLLCGRRRRVSLLPEHSLRLIPLVASTAAGSRTPRLSPRKHVGRAQAVWRCHLSSTARAHVCASTVNAFPVEGFFAKRVSDVWPAGVARQKRTAAAEQAPVS